MENTDIRLAPEFEKVISDLCFTAYTEIQEQCIPLIQQGRDVIGLSHTGSGKTAAFGFPSLETVEPGKGVQILVLVPTRELCTQVYDEFIKFTTYKMMSIVAVYGGVAINPQMQQLERADVVVGTPGRVLDHLSRGTLDLSKVRVLVLDEADKMFEMGFIDDVRKIISQTPKDRQTLLFSATMSEYIYEIVKRHMHDPVRIKMQAHVDKDKLVQYYYNVLRKDKFSLLVHMLKEHLTGLKIIFCATRQAVDMVDKNLNKHGFASEALHGGITQQRRSQIMQGFKSGKIDVLVASDVAARGLDIKHVDLIINYDLPKTSQEYVHRIGRTARAGKEGKVISLLSPECHDNFRRVLEDRDLLIKKMETPQFDFIPVVRPQREGGFRRGFSAGRGRSFAPRGDSGRGGQGRDGPAGYRPRGPRRNNRSRDGLRGRR